MKHQLRCTDITPPGLFAFNGKDGRKLRHICYSEVLRQAKSYYRDLSKEKIEEMIHEHTVNNMPEQARFRFAIEVVPTLKAQGKWKIIDIDSNRFLRPPEEELTEVGEPKVAYYNSSIVRFKGKLLMAYRRHRIQTNGGGNSDICIAELGGDYQPINNWKVQLPKHHDGEEHEDPKMFIFKGKLHLAYYSWKDWSAGYMPIQRLAALNNKFEATQNHMFEFGSNGNSTEKNWLYFDYEGDLHLLYWANPTHVIKIVGGSYHTYDKVPWDTKWAGLIKGGTPPVRIGDEYWTFYHSNQERYYMAGGWAGKRYVMGAYAFEAKPPFKVTRHTMPFLRGSEADPHLPWAPMVVFPNGAIYEKGKWIISMGVNDLYTSIMEISHKNVLKRCIENKEKPVVKKQGVKQQLV